MPVRISHALRGELRLPPVDVLVLVVGYRPQNTLLKELLNTGLNVTRIGDCSKVGKIQAAVKAGFEAALALQAIPSIPKNTQVDKAINR